MTTEILGSNPTDVLIGVVAKACQLNIVKVETAVQVKAGLV